MPTWYSFMASAVVLSWPGDNKKKKVSRILVRTAGLRYARNMRKYSSESTIFFPSRSRHWKVSLYVQGSILVLDAILGNSNISSQLGRQSCLSLRLLKNLSTIDKLFGGGGRGGVLLSIFGRVMPSVLAYPVPILDHFECLLLVSISGPCFSKVR